MFNKLLQKVILGYESIGFNSIIHNVNGIPFPLNTDNKRIAIAVSGGADSAILAYIICHLITEKNLDITVHIISNIRNWKIKPWQSYNSQLVYDYLVNKFHNIKFHRHENFVPPEFEWADKGPTMVDEYGNLQSGDIIELRAFSEYIAHHHKVDSWYVGVTKNPDEISDEGGMTNRSISDIDISKVIIQRESIMVCRPFVFLEKDKIISLYKYFNILDLLKFTRSCEGEVEGITYKNYTLGSYVPTCGTCFWCRERQWGISNAK